MTDSLILSVDAMGGDTAPDMVVAGIEIAHRQMPSVRFLVVGDERQIAPLMDKYPGARDVCEIRHTEDVVTSEMQPAVALRSGKKTSMRLAINAVGSGEAAGIISAGNTGALMAMAKFVLKTLPGISRPAIATYFPTQRGATVMLDLGANVNCDADNLVQFAVMGEVFARNVMSVDQPSIGILNIGVEGLKGNIAVKNAATILQDSDLPIKFYGFVEGDDIGAGTVDVIVTDGFTGNVALKTAEGSVRMFTSFLKDALTSSPVAKLGALLARPALEGLRQKFDPRLYNGAMLVGLNGICVKSHGGTDDVGFANAIRVTHELISHGFNDMIKEDLGHLITDDPETQAAVG